MKEKKGLHCAKKCLLPAQRYCYQGFQTGSGDSDNY